MRRDRLKLEKILFRQQQLELPRQPETGAAQFIDGFLFDNAVIGILLGPRGIEDHQPASGFERLPDFRKVGGAVIDVMIRVAEKDHVN